jgi:hypothetical protein
MQTLTKKKAPAPPTQIAFAESKYKIASLIRNIYGELGIKQGKLDLTAYCKANPRTVDKWLSIEAGELESINPHLMDKVLSFFNLQSECQLYTDAHNKMLKDERK